MFLPLYVRDGRPKLLPADRECAVFALPSKPCDAALAVDLTGRDSFDLPYESSWCLLRRDADHEMDVVFDTANGENRRSERPRLGGDVAIGRGFY